MEMGLFITLGNETMQTWEDVKEAVERGLKSCEGEVSDTFGSHMLRDTNGNNVGLFWITDAPTTKQAKKDVSLVMVMNRHDFATAPCHVCGNTHPGARVTAQTTTNEEITLCRGCYDEIRRKDEER